MLTESLVYHVKDKKFIAQLFTSEKSKKPIILVVHAWRGQDNFAREKAKWLAELGYVGVAIDLYGDAKEAKDNEEAATLMKPLFMDRAELRRRLIGALEMVRSLSWADTANLGAIGFCFGGLAVIELLRSGAPLKAAVTFHAVLGDEKEGEKAKTLPTEEIKGALLVQHGIEDPLVPWNQVKEFADEMTHAKADWEIDVYPAVHAFTNPEAKDNGVMFYNEKIAKKSFSRMETFFKTHLR